MAQRQKTYDGLIQLL